jgi:hypothetical protein
MLMRSLLASIVYGLIPESGGLATRFSDSDGSVEKSTFWTIITGLVYCLWLALLIFLSTLWRDHLDGKFVAISQFVEGILVGKNSLVTLISSLGDHHADGNAKTLNDVECGVKN